MVGTPLHAPSRSSSVDFASPSPSLETLCAHAGAGTALQRFTASRLPQGSAADALAVESHELLRGHKAVEIKHNGSIYRLQTTKLGKLILTK